MVDIPTSRSIRRATPSGQTPQSAGPQPILGRALQSFGGNITQASRFLDQAIEAQRAENEQAEDIEAERRFLQFQREQTELASSASDSVTPGATGFAEQSRAAYIENAKKFRDTLPDRLKDQYETPLFKVEDKITSSALKFERGQRREFFGAQIAEGLTAIEGNLFANPDEYDDLVAKGRSLIMQTPDSVLNKSEKAAQVRAWEQKAKIATLNGVGPEERIRLLGGVDNISTSVNPGTKDRASRRIKPEIQSIIKEEAERAGVPAEYMMVVAFLESGGNPKAQNKSSSAGGLFQQVDSNAKAYGVDNRLDPRQSAAGAARFMAENISTLRRVLGRDPTVGEVYLAHQQGPGGATKLLTNPNARAADLVGAAAVKLNGGKPDMTAAEFAGIWLKKAGDTHIPDGGMVASSFNPENADPRFKNFDYIDAQKAMQGAQKQILEGMETQRSIQDAQRELLDAQLGVSVSRGESTQADLDDALANQTISPKRWETLSEELISAGKKRDEKTESELNVAGLLERGEAVNGFDKDQRKGVNAIDERVTELSADEDELRANRLALIKKGSVAPEGMVNELRQGIANQDPAAFDLAMQARAANPRAFDGIPNAGSIVDALERFEAYTAANYSAEDAARMAAPTPQEASSRALVKDQVRAELKDITPETLMERFDTWAPGDAPEVLGATSTVMMGDFGLIYEQARADGMEPAAAKAFAEKRLFDPINGLYGVSEIGGGEFKDGKWFGKDLKTNNYLMRFPPERFYPQVDGSHDYIRNDIAESLRGLADFEGGSWFLVADQADTDGAVKLMREGDQALPGYRLFYEDADGAMQFKYWRMERDDVDARVQKANEKAAAEFQEQNRSARVTGIRMQLREERLVPGSPEWFKRFKELEQGD